MKSTGRLPKTNAQRYALFGALIGLLFPLAATLLYILESSLPFTLSSILTVQATVPLLWMIDTAPVLLGILAALAGHRQDKLEELNRMLKSREKELQAAQIELEERVKERTRELASMNQSMLERSEQLKSVVDISRSLLAAQGLHQLLSLVAEVISRQFNFYHTGVYLLDEQKRHAVLVSSSSEGGQQILQRGQHIRLGGQSAVDFAIRTGHHQMISDTSTDPAFQPQPELAGTCSQLVLPLKSGLNVIGALDLQSDSARDFTEEYMDMLLILADVATTAIENAIAQENRQRDLREVEVSARSGSGRIWSSWVESIRSTGYRYDGIRAEPLKDSNHSTASNDNIQSIPIRLRGQTIGRLKIKVSDAANGWSEDDRAIAEAAAERAALALEGARLLDEAKRRAARETFLSGMAAKLGASFRLDSIMRDTVEELGQTLEGATISFQLVNPSAPADGRGRADESSGTSGVPE